MSPREQRAPWRGEAELVCLQRKMVTATAYTQPIDEIEGPGTCGLDHPFRVSGLSDGQVYVAPSGRLGCPVTAALNVWMRDVVQPAAYARFGVQVAEVKNMASYGCRTRNNQRGAKLSEHSFGNALDIGGFVLTDGRQISVLNDWRRGLPETQAFLREVHAGACGIFKTVLGPGSDRFHENHLHLDLARHNVKQTAYCRPRPVTPEPAQALQPQMAPQDYEDMPMSYAPMPGGWPIGRIFENRRDDVGMTGSVRPATAMGDTPDGE